MINSWEFARTVVAALKTEGVFTPYTTKALLRSILRRRFRAMRWLLTDENDFEWLMSFVESRMAAHFWNESKWPDDATREERTVGASLKMWPAAVRYVKQLKEDGVTDKALAAFSKRVANTSNFHSQSNVEYAKVKGLVQDQNKVPHPELTENAWRLAAKFKRRVMQHSASRLMEACDPEIDLSDEDRVLFMEFLKQYPNHGVFAFFFWKNNADQPELRSYFLRRFYIGHNEAWLTMRPKFNRDLQNLLDSDRYVPDQVLTFCKGIYEGKTPTEISRGVLTHDEAWRWIRYIANEQRNMCPATDFFLMEHWGKDHLGRDVDTNGVPASEAIKALPFARTTKAMLQWMCNKAYALTRKRSVLVDDGTRKEIILLPMVDMLTEDMLRNKDGQVDINRSADDVLEAIKAKHKEGLLLKLGVKTTFPTIEMKPHEHLIPIRSVGELNQEATEMKHCVWNRASDCLTGQRIVFSVRVGDDRSTLEVYVSGSPKQPVFYTGQHLGVHNTTPPPKCIKAVKEWVELNAARR